MEISLKEKLQIWWCGIFGHIPNKNQWVTPNNIVMDSCKRCRRLFSVTTVASKGK